MKQAEKMVLFDDERARFVAEFFRGRVYLHLKVRKWNLSTLKLMLELWPEFRRIFFNIGYPKVNAYYPVTNKLMPRFSGMFGFREVKRNNGWVLLETEAYHA